MQRAQQLLEQAERCVSAQQPSQALEALCALLQHHRNNLARSFGPQAWSAEEFRQFCGRFSATWIALCRHPLWDPLVDPGISQLLCDLTELYALVGCSPDGHLDRAIEAQAAHYQQVRQPVEFLKLILLWTPLSEAWTNPFHYFESARAVVLAQALATAASMVACRPRADESRNAALELLASGRVLPADLGPFILQPVFASAWFRSSYATWPGKHGIKKVMNSAISVAIANAESSSGPAPAPHVPALGQKDHRRRLVVPLEWSFIEGGAMYRCYAPLMRELRRHFFTIGLSEQRASNHTTAGLFDVHFHYEDLAGGVVADIRTLAAAIRAFEPSMMFYPSVGMLRVVIMLANLRLAPVQAMTIGHPATSGSPVMDYILAESSFVGKPDIFSEHFVPVPDGSLAFDAPAVELVGQSHAGTLLLDDGRLHVAVPAVSHKISWSFLRTLQAVENAAPGRFMFHFYTGLSGTCYYEMCTHVGRVLRDVRIYPTLDYAPYIASINECHVHAASFPFGGTNSLIDSLRQGLPVVAMRGREVHECIDAEFVRRLGLEEDLVACTEEGYAAILLRFVNEPGFLERMRRHVAEADVGAVLMRNGKPGLFADAIAGLVRPAGG